MSALLPYSFAKTHGILLLDSAAGPAGAPGAADLD